MDASSNTWHQPPWDRLYRFINKCGSNHDLLRFSAAILEGISDFVRFDRGLVYFLDGNGHIHNQYLLNFKDSWSNLYLDYYSKASFSEFSIDKRNIRETPGRPYIDIIRWYEQPVTEFVSDYIQAQALQLSLGFVLFDLNGLPRIAFALDRMTREEFTEDELDILYIVVPSLNNLHKNFYAKPVGEADFSDSIWQTSGLTEREIEVVNLLCQGVKPNSISKALHIAPSTTYKHVAHIYEKLGVSSLQELLVLVLNRRRE
jgi:DNA-binding CsgD family transcriptional regulator